MAEEQIKTKVLKRWITTEGYECVIVQCIWPAKVELAGGMPSGNHLCGYLRVPRHSKFFGVGYRSIDINVHGGLTYADQYNPDHEDKSKHQWWIGFDCAHYSDTPERCDLPYCIEQCKSMSEQMAGLDSKSWWAKACKFLLSFFK